MNISAIFTPFTLAANAINSAIIKPVLDATHKLFSGNSTLTTLAQKNVNMTRSLGISSSVLAKPLGRTSLNQWGKTLPRPSMPKPSVGMKVTPAKTELPTFNWRIPSIVQKGPFKTTPGLFPKAGSFLSKILTSTKNFFSDTLPRALPVIPTKYLPLAPTWLVNGVAGFGDSTLKGVGSVVGGVVDKVVPYDKFIGKGISESIGGLTDDLRELRGVNHVVDKTSLSYKAGSIVGEKHFDLLKVLISKGGIKNVFKNILRR